MVCVAVQPGSSRKKAEFFENLNDANQLLTTKELAARLNVAEWTLRQWHSSGRLRGIKVGPKIVRYRWDDVLKWLQKEGV